MVDFDDTMTDLLTPWVNELNNRYATNVKPENIKDWYITGYFDLSADEVYSPLHDPEFWEKVHARENVEYYLHRLITEGHDVYIVTNTNYNILPIKVRHCFRRLFPFINTDNILVAKDKYLIKGDVIIDDAFHNLVNCDCKKIMITTHSNKAINDETLKLADITRCDNWDQIYDTIANMKAV